MHAGSHDKPVAPRELGATLSGRKLAHFLLEEFVGGGGMGAVFRATDTMLDRTVAVKVLSRDQGRDDETVKRFRNEAQSAARLDHENIARVYYVGEDDGWYFIVFEYIEGQNLRDNVTAHGAMAFDQALQVTMQITYALKHSAERDVVHRDIKPSNVLLTPTGKAKLVDMGLARLRPMQASDEDLTASGVTLGTFDYISPEQARDPRTADVRSDIYSLGCTFFFMLTSHPPFPDGTVLQKLLSHSSDAPPDPRKWRNDLPASIVPVMNRMLAKLPDNRYQSPSNLAFDLHQIAAQIGLLENAEPVWTRENAGPWQRIQHHLPWIAPVLTLIVLFFAWDPAWLDGGVPTPVPRFSEPLVTDTPTAAVDNSTAVDESASPPTNLLDIEAANLANGIANPTTEAEPTSNGPDTVRTLIVDRQQRNRATTSDDGVILNDLAEACRMALQSQNIDRIEIRENGPIEMRPFALTLAGQSITIAAGDGFAPTLSFQTPTSAPAGDEFGMIRLQGRGQLRFAGLRLEMTVPIETLDGEWCLFQLESGQSVQLHESVVSVHNSYGGRFRNLDDVAVFSCFYMPSQTRPENAPESNEPIGIQISNSVIRCEATVLRAAQAMPIQFNWDNGLLITSERLVTVGGRDDVPHVGEAIKLSVNHLTAVVDQGLGEFTASTANPHLLPIEISTQNSIWITQRWSTLISQSGSKNLAQFMEQISLNGSHNAYEGMESLWMINPQDPSQAESFDIEMWRSHWRNMHRQLWQQVQWRYPIDQHLPIHEHLIADYQLDSNADEEQLKLGYIPSTLPSLNASPPTRSRNIRPSFPF